MIIRNILTAGLMLVWTGIAHAADMLTVQDVQVAPNKSVTLAVCLDNETTNLMGWQCDIVLPEGLTLVLKENGKPNATLGNRFATTEHKISSSVLANNTYRFIGMSMEGEAIPDNSGTLFMVTLMADASLAEQAGMWPAPTLLGIIKKIEFNTQDNQKITFSDVSFNVNIINHPQVIYDLKQGWNWISTSATTEASSFLEPIKDKTQRLVSQTQELINDAEYGLVGGLQTMEVTAGYKLKMEEEVTAYLTGNFADPSATQVQLYKGWNWIGYVPMVALPVGTALENLQATAGDQLVCKDEFAEYDGSAWVPADIVMEPGKGYMYK